MKQRFFVLLALSLALAVACGSDDGEVDVSNRDPRCVTACPATMPRYEGAGAICDAASREQCLDECETRIAGVSPLCQSCLVEEACFAPEGDGCGSGDVSIGCNTTTCTVYGEFGQCDYPYGDMAAELRCRQQVDPRREVTCTPEFRPTTECASVCQ
jgi:hypothetical protein